MPHSDRNPFARRVKVNRGRTPQEALGATGLELYKGYDDKAVVDAMPRGSGEDTEVIFFTVDRLITDDELAKEYEQRGLKPADPISLAPVNQEIPWLGDQWPNGTHWKDATGNWCFAAFRSGNYIGHLVYVARRKDPWAAGYWFAALPK